MYVPKHLELLSRSGTADGWPQGISEASKAWAEARIKAGLEKYGQLDLDTARRCIYDHYIDNEPVPEDLKGQLWDWLYAVTHRALLAVSAQQVWVAEKSYAKKRKTAKEWIAVPISKADAEALATAGEVTVGVVGQRIRLLANEVKVRLGN
jgi:hypothetical protein